MNYDIDQEDDYDTQAINAIESGLSNYDIDKDKAPPGFAKEEIVEIYFESRNMLRSEPEDKFLFTVAKNVFYLCIHIVRCLFLPDKEAKIRIIRGKKYTLDASVMYPRMHSEYKRMKALEEGL